MTQDLIRFVFPPEAALPGSTRMRVHQLSRMLRPHLPDRIALEIAPLPDLPRRLPRMAREMLVLRWANAQPPGAILIFAKAAKGHLSPALADALRQRGCRICIDHVDSDVRLPPGVAPDVHLCSSHAQRAEILRIQAQDPAFPGTAMLLLHNYDEALIGLPPAQTDHFACAFIGTRAVGYLPPRVAQRITVIPVESAQAWTETLPRLPAFNCHCCLRDPAPADPRIIKPFTKAFTAAACGAVVLADRQTPDAETMLGADYPYLLEAPDEADLLALLDRARDGFGGPDWQLARDRMEAVARAVAPKALAAQLLAVADEIRT